MEYLVLPIFGAFQDLTAILIEDEVDVGTRYEYIIGTHVKCQRRPVPGSPIGRAVSHPIVNTAPNRTFPRSSSAPSPRNTQTSLAMKENQGTIVDHLRSPALKGGGGGKEGEEARELLLGDPNPDE